MELSQRDERTSFTLSSVGPPLDLLPAGWHGIGSRPLEIDMGCHKGRFLVAMAQRCPASNFLGVERQRERVEKARKKIVLHGLGNAEVLHGDGLEILERLPEACANCVHVLFPDPWPKRRHKIRRMVGGRFLLEVLRILKVRGVVRLVTDDGAYARAMGTCAAQIRAFQPRESNLHHYPPTEFQIKVLADARPVYELAFERLN
jgi:tRNA (guanine-N7-)-methyltransferase